MSPQGSQIHSKGRQFFWKTYRQWLVLFTLTVLALFHPVARHVNSVGNAFLMITAHILFYPVKDTVGGQLESTAYGLLGTALSIITNVVARVLAVVAMNNGYDGQPIFALFLALAIFFASYIRSRFALVTVALSWSFWSIFSLTLDTKSRTITRSHITDFVYPSLVAAAASLIIPLVLPPYTTASFEVGSCLVSILESQQEYLDRSMQAFFNPPHGRESRTMMRDSLARARIESLVLMNRFSQLLHDTVYELNYSFVPVKSFRPYYAGLMRTRSTLVAIGDAVTTELFAFDDTLDPEMQPFPARKSQPDDGASSESSTGHERIGSRLGQWLQSHFEAFAIYDDYDQLGMEARRRLKTSRVQQEVSHQEQVMLSSFRACGVDAPNFMPSSFYPPSVGRIRPQCESLAMQKRLRRFKLDAKNFIQMLKEGYTATSDSIKWTCGISKRFDTSFVHVIQKHRTTLADSVARFEKQCYDSLILSTDDQDSGIRVFGDELYVMAYFVTSLLRMGQHLVTLENTAIEQLSQTSLRRRLWMLTKFFPESSDRYFFADALNSLSAEPNPSPSFGDFKADESAVGTTQFAQNISTIRRKIAQISTAITHSSHLKYAFKVSLTVSLAAIPAYHSSSSWWFQTWRCQWALATILYVMEKSLALTIRTLVLRMSATVLGAITGYVVSEASRMNPYGIAALMGVFAIPFMYVQYMTRFGPITVVWVVTWAPVIFVHYYGASNESSIMLAVIRGTTVATGIMIALLANMLIFPYRARAQLTIEIHRLLQDMTDMYAAMSRRLLHLELPGDVQRYERRLWLHINRATALLHLTRLEIRLKGPFPSDVVSEMLYRLEILVSRMLTLCETRRHFGSTIYQHTVHDIIENRRRFIADLTMSLYALDHAIISQSPLPQYISNPRPALVALKAAIQNSISTDMEMNADNRKGSENGLLHSFAEFLVLSQMISDVSYLLYLAKQVVGEHRLTRSDDALMTEASERDCGSHAT